MAKRRPAAWVHKPLYFDNDAIERIVDAVGLHLVELDGEQAKDGATIREYMSMGLDGALKIYLRDRDTKPPSHADARAYFTNVAARANALLAALDVAAEPASGLDPSWGKVLSRWAKWPNTWDLAELRPDRDHGATIIQAIQSLHGAAQEAAGKMNRLAKQPARRAPDFAKRRLAIDIMGEWQSAFGRSPTNQPTGAFRRFVDAVVMEINQHTSPRLTLSVDLFRRARGR